MSSQPTIFLRPPPNVPFVQGFPGIGPSLPQRPQAAVKGTVELRIGSQGVKAKWLRIELRKIEVLPGGGAANTYFDFVGQSPISLWQAQDEWNPIFTQDFPFYIRIPESIPPTITLEKSAGIRFELIATLAMKGKRGFLRRSTITSVTTTEPVIIDKHDIHSTWPVYSQPESRDVTSDALTLAVSRTQSCFGPGDRVPVVATLHSNNLSTIVLRAFEYVLKEVIIYRASHIPSKNSAPQVKATVIGEQKVPVNATLYGGTQHRLELSTFIPKTHTSTTVKTARHIDISYTISVKAVLASGRSITIDLPVTVSNWTRNASVEAIKRIGPVTGLSLDAATESRDSISDDDDEFADFNEETFHRENGQDRLMPNESRNGPDTFVSTQHGEMRNGILKGLTTASLNRKADEHGYSSNGGATQTRLPQPVTFSGRSSATSNAIAVGGRRANSISHTGIGNRFAVANDIIGIEGGPQGFSAARPNTAVQGRTTEFRPTQASLTRTSTDIAKPTTSRPETAQTTNIMTNKAFWLSAEEEKQRLFNQARADAERVQSSMGNDAFAQVTVRRHVDAGPLLGSDAQRISDNSAWLSTEEEKMRLYEDAQARARRSQSQAAKAVQSPTMSPIIGHGHGYSVSMTSLNSISSPSIPASAVQTIASTVRVNKNRHPKFSTAPSNEVHDSLSTSKVYPTAEEEKAALRYYEAKRAVDRRQGDMDGAESSTLQPDELIPYDALYPGNGSMTSPDFTVESSSGNTLSLKPLSQHNVRSVDAQQTNSNNHTSPSNQRTTNNNDANAQLGQWHYEYETRSSDRPIISNGQQPDNNLSAFHPQLSQAAAPQMTGVRPLTAAEEKEQLRARYETEDAIAAPNPYSPYTPKVSNMQTIFASPNIQSHREYYDEVSVPPPPPLMPRPPAEYIRETEEQDMRCRNDHLIPEEYIPTLFNKHYMTKQESSHPDKHPYALAGEEVNLNTETSPPSLPPKIPILE